jgi:hypothetical protein
MEMIFLMFLAALGVAGWLGWAADSRDGADWAPSDGGLRVPRRSPPRGGRADPGAHRPGG